MQKDDAMVTGIWGRKVGMTQVFAEDKVVPVTVINLAHWVVTGLKTLDRDGYRAVQIGHVRPRYAQQTFSHSWLKKPKKYFVSLKELKTSDKKIDIEIGSTIDYQKLLEVGSLVDVVGTTRGRGFAGVVKRHGFAGGPGSHGTEMGRFPGSIGHIRACGKVIKGKRLPGQLGFQLQ